VTSSGVVGPYSSCSGSGLVRFESLVSESGALHLVVLEAPTSVGTLQCDGRQLRVAGPRPCSVPASVSPVVHIAPLAIRPGDRLRDPESGLELICPTGGSGRVTFAGRELRLHRKAERLRARRWDPSGNS